MRAKPPKTRCRTPDDNATKMNKSQKSLQATPLQVFLLQQPKAVQLLLDGLFTYISKSGERKKANETDEKASRMAVVCNADFHGTADNRLCG